MKTQVIANKRQAIIWGRFSSDKQADGDSRERQERLNRALAKREGIHVIKEHFDPAASVKDGATPLFKKVIASLPEGVGIITENLDRINRGHPWRAKAFIADILEAGHFIITSQDGREYNADSISQLETLLLGDMATNVAYAENSKRTKRVREAKAQAVALSRKGIPSPLGSWLPPHLKYNFDTKQYDIRQDRLNIVKRIFKEYAAGKGVTSICKGLNLDKLATFRFKRGWSKVTIFTMLRYEGLIGVLNYNEERIPKAFPLAIKEDLFYKVQSMLQVNKQRHGKYSSNTVRNIFRGLCHCSNCGNRMQVTADNYLGCSGYQIGKCSIKHMVRFKELEQEFLQWFIPQAKDLLLGKDEGLTGIKTLEAKLNGCIKRIDETLSLLDEGLAVAQVKERLIKLQKEKDKLEDELQQSRAEHSSKSSFPDTLHQLDMLIDGCIEGNQEARKKVSSIVPSIVKDVVIDIEHRHQPSFQVTLHDGQTLNWTYHIVEYAQELKAISKDGKMILGKGKVTEGGFKKT
jgi:DNA invertase Pin-like site-specific DNA recombinase